MRRLLPVLLVSLVVLLPTTSGATGGCSADHVAVSFAPVHGSAGAGHITYELKIRNTGSTCTVSGRPALRLRGAHDWLPTHEVADHPGTGAAVLVTLRHGRVARSEVRFSPDIPGKGEGDPCEPIAYKIHVTLPSPAGGGRFGPIKPPTRVCEHGRLVV